MMEDIKRRTEVVRIILMTVPPILEPWALYELSYLQYRKICELIALGCLVAHGDIVETKSKKMQETYDANEILKRLERLHPDFYPRPHTEAIDAGKVVTVGSMGDDYLTKKELLKLHAFCGSVLHVGSLKSFQTPGFRTRESQEIADWSNKILALLNHHRMALSTGWEFWVDMTSKQNQRPIGYILKRT